ncbi:MAG: hypothetical protein FWF15_11870, partial [Oscillospiraceae bacterium]|nr:hypothetical protein [Oscillospiraceae bacterium]
MALTLPPLRDKNLNFAHFPTVYQCFIYRNWETVTPKKLAEILGTDEATVLKAADDMGLDTNIEVDPMWYEAGYITIIRNNWHLITYEQLCNLLEWDKDKLAYVL